MAEDAAAAARRADQHVEALAVPLDPRVAPVLAVVPARVGLEQQVLALPRHEVGGDRAADPLHLPVLRARDPAVVHPPPAVVAQDAAGPGGEVVERAGRAGAERVGQHVPRVQVARYRVADRRVDVPQLRVAERARRLQIEHVDVVAVAGEPEVPHPVPVEPKRHRARLCH